MNNIVSIAMATYNGSNYIKEMLDSIKLQTYPFFRIHICDDGSTDNTLEVIKMHSLYHENKICIHDTDGGNGALKNFTRTIQSCPKGYIALCDQDDYWLPEKLEILLARIQEAELMCKGPKLIFSDLEIVDSNLVCLYSSFFSVSGKDSNCKDPRDFLLSNHIPGCATLFNAELKELIEPIPDNVRMHDWWINAIAACYGEIIFEPKCLIKYRQHGGNAIGAENMIRKQTKPIRFLKNILTVIKRSRVLQNALNLRNDSLMGSLKNSVSPSDDFIKFIRGDMSIIQKKDYLKSMRSGESKLVASCSKWFI